MDINHHPSTTHPSTTSPRRRRASPKRGVRESTGRTPDGLRAWLNEEEDAKVMPAAKPAKRKLFKASQPKHGGLRRILLFSLSVTFFYILILFLPLRSLARSPPPSRTLHCEFNALVGCVVAARSHPIAFDGAACAWRPTLRKPLACVPTSSWA